MAAYEDVLSDEVKKFKDYEAEESAFAHYVYDTYLARLLRSAFPYDSFAAMLEHYARAAAERRGAPVRVVSLGSGNCDVELALACVEGLDCRFTCYDINPHMAERARERAAERGVEERFDFRQADLNKIQLEGPYDLVIANHSLHHFVELEHIFDQVHDAMEPESVFLVNDMIGRNGHMFYGTTLELTNRLWSLLPKELKQNRATLMHTPSRYQFDQSVANFEGIRAADIVPCLEERFRFRDFAPFFPLVNRFFDRDFGPNFALDDPLHRAFIDLIIALDERASREHLLRPTQMLACLTRSNAPASEPRWLFYRTPGELCAVEEKLYEVFEPTVAVSLDEERPSLARLATLLRMSALQTLLLVRSNPTGLKLIRFARQSLVRLRDRLRGG